MDDLIVARDLATREVQYLMPHQNINEAMELFAQLDVEQLPVARSNDPQKAVGMISRADIVAAYNREILTRRVQ